MRFFFYFVKSLRYGLISKESVVVLLAFTLTVGVYGFVVYTYVSSLVSQSSSTQFVVGPLLVNYYDGRVWRVVIPLSTNSSMEFRLTNVSVGLVVGGGSIPVIVSDSVNVVENRFVLGSVVNSLASGKVLVSKVIDNSVTREYVDLFVYVDQVGRLNVVVDDDSDGVLDSSYLLRFIPDARIEYELSLGSDVVLSVGKGVTLPLNYLDIAAILSMRPNPQIVVVAKDVTYVVYVSDILHNLRSATLVAWISSRDLRLDPGEYAYLTILLPPDRLVEGDDFSIELYVSGVRILNKVYRIPKGLASTGTLVLS